MEKLSTVVLCLAVAVVGSILGKPAPSLYWRQVCLPSDRDEDFYKDFFVTTRPFRVTAAHADEIGGRQRRTTEVCSLHAARREGVADCQDRRRGDQLRFFFFGGRIPAFSYQQEEALSSESEEEYLNRIMVCTLKMKYAEGLNRQASLLVLDFLLPRLSESMDTYGVDTERERRY